MAIVRDPTDLVTPGDLGDELSSFLRSMRAQNVSPNTILAYGGAVKQFGTWLMDRGYSTTVADIEPGWIEEWMDDLLHVPHGRRQEVSKPATAHNRWRGLQRFFNWYASRVDKFESPMRKLHPPRLSKQAPRVLTMDEIRLVLGTCTSKSFEDLRDQALIRLLFDTGARRHEIAELRYSLTDPDDRDVDIRRGIVFVRHAKGDKNNTIGIADRTLTALDDYLRVRRKHTDADLPWLWLGRRGRMTDSGIAQTLRTRGLRVGIQNLHAHDFRHSATHYELDGGMREADVMSKRGWDSPAMLRRYAATTANARSIEASRKLGLGDKL